MTPSRLHLAIALALAAPVAFAQTAPTPKSDATTLDQVIVTGTRVSDRTVAESTSPIDIITPEVLQSTGTTELATALSRALPSLNFPRPALTDGTSAIRPAQLRGLAPDQVLVLVNGKRRHTTALLNVNGSQGRGSSPVDLNAIPVSAIERVEVLRDGASAQYGSDAIAGVVNIVLKGAGSGGSIDATYGQYSAGDGKQWQLAGDTGIALGDAGGFLHIAAQVGDQDSTNRARPFAGTPSATQPELGQKAFVYGDPEVESWALSLNTVVPLSDTMELYAFGMASERDITSFAFFRAPRNANQNIPSIYPDGFLPRINNIADDRSLVAGLRGDAGDWKWDLSYNYGYNHLDFHTRNTLNASLGPSSPTSFYDGALEVTQNIVNFDLSRQFDWGLAYPVNLAFGGEYREEKWNQSPGEPDSWRQGPLPPPIASGAQGFPGFRASDAGHYSRDSYALYADLEANFTERFSGGAAVRFEDYSDFGNQTSGKVSGRYEFTDAVALRGTISTGFRAPSLSQQNFQTTSTTFIAGITDPFEIRTFPAAGEIARALGSEPLQPEEATSYSLGLVLQPVDRLYITADAYQVDVDDRIVLSSNLTGDAVRRFLEARGIFGVTGGRYFTNAIDTRTRGIDIVGSYRWDLANGSFNLTGGYNYSKTEITRVAANPPELETGGLNLERLDRAERGRIEKGFPRDKFVLSGTWKVQDWTFLAGTTRYGSFQTTPNASVNDQTYGAKWLVDLAATYHLDRWSFTLGGDNVLNEYPDENIFGNSTNGQFPYNSASPFGFNGAYMYAKIGYRW
ncbi:MAG TPA: TonB-dependent receptor [Lysobacter sp.]|nr:TonB-dependent receptor [Lysobacter sp.]